MTNTTESAIRDVNTGPAAARRSGGPALGDAQLRRLRVFNAAAGLLHLLSAVAVLLLNNGFRAVAAFLLLSAFFTSWSRFDVRAVSP